MSDARLQNLTKKLGEIVAVNAIDPTICIGAGPTHVLAFDNATGDRLRS